ncbi:MAG TPA: Lsr2 family protein [Dermatophilaceae bacterium]|nr:Lsr2 family protein [Dermatophilaceae bacterium]
MAQRTRVVMVDDITGEPIAEGRGETVLFAVDGVTYQIDLEQQEARKLRDTLDYYASHARRTGGRRTTPTRLTITREYDTKTVRRWAQARGLDVPARGRIPHAVIEAFQAAGN